MRQPPRRTIDASPKNSLRLGRRSAKVAIGPVWLHALLFPGALLVRHLVDFRVARARQRDQRHLRRDDRHLRRPAAKLERPFEHQALQHFVDPPDVTEPRAALTGDRTGFRGCSRPLGIVRGPRLKLFVDPAFDDVVTIIGNLQQSADRHRRRAVGLRAVERVAQAVGVDERGLRAGVDAELGVDVEPQRRGQLLVQPLPLFVGGVKPGDRRLQVVAFFSRLDGVVHLVGGDPFLIDSRIQASEGRHHGLTLFL